MNIFGVCVCVCEYIHMLLILPNDHDIPSLNISFLFNQF